MNRFAKFTFAGLVVAGVPGAAPGREAPSIFKDTIAETTYVELEKSAQTGAVALWALGSIEEHGPHLPLGTDAYIASAQLRAVREILRGGDVKA